MKKTNCLAKASPRRPPELKSFPLRRKEHPDSQRKNPCRIRNILFRCSTRCCKAQLYSYKKFRHKSQLNYGTLSILFCDSGRNRRFWADIPTLLNYLNEYFTKRSIMVIMKQEVQSALTFLKYRMELARLTAAL